MPPLPHHVANWLSSGEEFLAQGNYVQALAAFEHALGLAQHSCHPKAQVLALQRLGYAHLEQGQPSLSVASIQQAIAIALEQQNLNDLYECHRQLAQTYKSMGFFELALQHLEAAEVLRGSLDWPSTPAGSTAIDAGVLAAEVFQRYPRLGEQGRDAVTLLFQSIVEQANVGVAIFQDERLVYGNPRLMQWVGYSSQDLETLTLADLVAPGPELDLTTLGAVAAGPGEGQLLSKTGHSMAVEIYATAVDISDRRALVTFLHDITAAQRMADQLKASESRYRSLIDHVPIGLCRFSVEGQPLDGNPALLSIFGFDAIADLLQASPIQPSSPVIDQAQPMLWRDYLRQAGTLKDCELNLSRSDGRNLWVRVVARAIADASGTIQYYEGAVEDITEIKAAQIALQELAMRDSLTHIYNRRHFIELASQELARSARFNRPVTLLMIDIDHFKTINDTYGHLVGDTVLRDIALRIKTNLRQSDILARYGGEEFILMMPETDQTQALSGAERLRQMIATTPFDSGSDPLSVTASIGLSCWPANPDANAPLPHINDLISKADLALYRAKHSGRNQTQAEAWFYSVSRSTKT
ncbi:diguanylate cyclase [Nodosilinea sp. LEGE 06152]|uniref:sensor domain-containing diguanylate cyclase n=1 Tax=Nodosilinea sp. LEGE 06152 TaxID=2777966 RepID=UPI001882F724|nr:diguanylate cyclase [Nodosilinea sp. LEGE 06152]MBE9159318.1 diguanylate cyclase [Nodosilinea sp. LEGE 06152]